MEYLLFPSNYDVDEWDIFLSNYNTDEWDIPCLGVIMTVMNGKYLVSK